LVDHLDPDPAGIAGASEADRPASEQQLSLARRVQPGQYLHQSRFAGAIIPDNTQNFALPQRKIHMIQRGNRAKILADAVCFEQRGGRSGAGCGRQAEPP
jgi:hypothetical protein